MPKVGLAVACYKYLRLKDEGVSQIGEQLKKLTQVDREELSFYFAQIGLEVDPGTISGREPGIPATT
jgi:hypothetical protein